MTDGRESDPAPYRDLQRHLERVDEHLMQLRTDFNAERVSTEQRFSSVKEAISERGRFPVTAWVALFGILISVVGSGGFLYAEQREGISTAHKALNLIEQHLAQAPTHRYNVERLSEWQDQVRDVIPTLKSDVESLKGRIVGNTAEGWHRRDHELYAESVRLRFENLEQRVHVQEDRSQVRDGWWDQVKAKGLLK